MTEAKVEREFANWSEFARIAMGIKFPGCGFGADPRVQGKGREFFVEAIEIPRVLKHRFLVLERLTGRRLRLVDDFVMGDSPNQGWRGFSQVEQIGEELVYRDRKAVVVRTTKLP